VGVDVVHSFGARGYPLDQSLAGLWRPAPTFIHGNGAKPWIIFHETHVPKLSFYNGSTTLIAKLSPYTAMCRRYSSQIGVATPWLRAAFDCGNCNFGMGAPLFAGTVDYRDADRSHGLEYIE
jgi:hypothetical protein